MPKQKVEIERLLQWAYRDELPKKRLSSADGNVWGMVEDYAMRGGVDIGQSAAQRYPHHGLPHPDALKIEEAVGALADYAVDWANSIDHIAGDLAGLVSINSLQARATGNPGKATKSGWTDLKTKRWTTANNRPRDLIMVGTIRPKVLVTVHAKQGTRPDWREQDPRPKRILAATSGQVKIENGTCEGRDRYSTGTVCPLEWFPSPAAVILSRADYLGWWNALRDLVASLDMSEYQATPPNAPELPWFGECDRSGNVIFVPPTASDPSIYPLTPQRDRALAPYRRSANKPELAR